MIALMITSWLFNNLSPEDVRIGAAKHAGLPNPSVLKKLALSLFILLGTVLAQRLPAIELQLIADSLTLPTYATHAGDGSRRLFIVQLDGFVRVWQDGELLETPFLDLDGIVTALAGEQGMYSIVFHPEFADNRRFFVSYTEFGTDDLVVVEHQAFRSNPNLAYRQAYRQEIIRYSPHDPYHHGGQLKFGPDGYLYVSVGDGTGPLFEPREDFDVAQHLDVLAGSLLRLDVDSATPYAIPADNPFTALPWVRPEIYAYGFRNPWRFSFDPETEHLYLGDVGNYDWEEINLIRAGGNYGWPAREGPVCFVFPSNLEPAIEDCDNPRYLAPLLAYGHVAFDAQGGNAVIGGYVYRGEDFPELQGLYFYGDFTNGRIWAFDTTLAEPKGELLLETDLRITSFVENEAGELYVLDILGGMYRLVPRAN